MQEQEIVEVAVYGRQTLLFAHGEMAMMHRMICCGLILAGLASTSAVAQNTLGELLDAGGKKLSQEGVQAAFSGAHVTGKTATGADGEYDYKADGSFTGNVQGPQGGLAGIIGTWTAAEGGKLCVEWTLTGRGSRKSGGCGYYYTLSDRYYLSESDSDRNSAVLKRTLRK